MDTQNLPEEIRYAAKTGYEEGYESAAQYCAQIIIEKERLLAEWLKWAEHYGHHCEGLDAKTRAILPPQFLPENSGLCRPDSE